MAVGRIARIALESVPSAENAADGFAKGLDWVKHQEFIKMLGLKQDYLRVDRTESLPLREHSHQPRHAVDWPRAPPCSVFPRAKIHHDVCRRVIVGGAVTGELFDLDRARTYDLGISEQAAYKQAAYTASPTSSLWLAPPAPGADSLSAFGA